MCMHGVLHAQYLLKSTHRSILLLLKSSFIALNSCDKQLRGSPRAHILHRLHIRP